MRRIDLSGITSQERSAITRRSAVPSAAIRAGAADIIAAVRTGGDDALASYGERFGGGSPGGTLVSKDEIAAALEAADPALLSALDTAIAHVDAVHRDQIPAVSSVEVTPGVLVERRWSPLRRVGCYVPGGAAPLPSTLVMTVVPALAAGVESIAVATPARPDGSVYRAVLAAAGLLGIDEVHAMGGAQAIAALAYGTKTIAPVDKIVGPGNAWVTAAKLAVSGECAVDMPAGPSEALILADTSTDPRLLAADLLAQAEHGPDSPVVLVTTTPEIADAVLEAIDELMGRLDRRGVIERALANHGLVAVARSLDDAIAFADEWAPEHLSIHLSDPETAVDCIRSAGSVFVGPWAPEPVGDYASGANHVLPTGGLASALGPLGTEDFGSWRQVQRLTRSGLKALRPAVTTLASAEGLTAHRLAVDIRFEDGT
ncbi:histidinol dehydrogenase [bacterium]|nr:histidinol dehydrogenase [bacterium]